MSGSVLAFYVFLIVLLVVRLASSHRRKSSESYEAETIEDALARIKEHYPDAVSGPWQPDCSGWLPVDEAMSVWENPEAQQRNLPPVASIRRYAP
jgi:hypothetical protein